MAVARVNKSLEGDREAVQRPDCNTPFESFPDAFRKLMKYHIFFEPDTKDSYLKRGSIKIRVRLSVNYRSVNYIPPLYNEYPNFVFLSVLYLSHFPFGIFLRVLHFSCKMLTIFISSVDKLHDEVSQKLDKRKENLFNKYYSRIMADVARPMPVNIMN